MNTYFISTWRAQLSKAAAKRTEKAVRAIDPSANLVLVSIPGNDVRMWLERPNDGCNDHTSQRAANGRMVDAVNAALADAE